ncbi:radical SAM protein [Brevundimonas sp. A19_0]|uniref:B12-binding domain-containing radical SAM protein n=1 Tax=Brevundimonas sp. A19_0 TaxID=2821087 RepID=UPI001ADA0958|nr:radical SAM protein [Brevundimonas sp. A19_0]MBO9500681.1 B12-binding domain-containing radical SAM protein [Brevundimonas sp. A19_0]
MVRFLLIAPRPHWDADFGGIAGGPGDSVTRVAPIAIATVAAMAPEGIEVALHDEALAPVDFEARADFIGITANVSQARRAIEIAREFRARGKPVIIGGPHITLDPQVFDGACDVAVTGEFEEIAESFYADMLGGTLKPRYVGGRPDLARSPVPAWQLFDNDRALVGVVQTSRGCPFECNYCDVIQYLGRKQRHKTPDQVITEVQRLYDLGYNRIALADDNFTVYRKRAAELLDALSAWNGRDGRDHVIFATQVSIDVARDDDMLTACAEAGVSNLFIGVESVNEESLKASKKRQNLNTDMQAQLRKVVSHGLKVEAALMVGFDADDLTIFERQYRFGMGLPVGTFKISSLVAPMATPIYAEMLQAGRLDLTGEQAHFPGADMVTNIVPAQMTRQQLYTGTRWLISRLYSPAAFWTRFEALAEILGPNPLLQRGTGRLHNPPSRAKANAHFGRMARAIGRAYPDIAEVIGKANRLMRARPEVRDGLADILTTWMLSLYVHIEKGVYDPEWALMDGPPFERARSAA